MIKIKLLRWAICLISLLINLWREETIKNNTNSININQQNLPGTSNKKRFNATSIEWFVQTSNFTNDDSL